MFAFLERSWPVRPQLWDMHTNRLTFFWKKCFNKLDFGTRYSWEKTNNFISKITAKNFKQQLHFKDSQPQLLRSNVVYRLNCSCRSFYIGQTRRNLVKRLDEHQTSLNSEVCNDLQSNPNHRVDFNNPQILTSSPDKSKLLILESLYIQQLEPSLNLDSKSFPLRLFNTWPSLLVCLFLCQYGVVASQPVWGTLFTLKMAPVEGRNVRSMFLTSCLAVIFEIKLDLFWQH